MARIETGDRVQIVSGPHKGKVGFIRVIHPTPILPYVVDFTKGGLPGGKFIEGMSFDRDQLRFI